MPHYANDGSKNATVVTDPNSFVGARGADGGTTMFQVNGSTFVGAYNKSGARNVILTNVDQTSPNHPSGAIYVSTGTYKKGTIPSTATSGTFV